MRRGPAPLLLTATAALLVMGGLALELRLAAESAPLSMTSYAPPPPAEDGLPTPEHAEAAATLATAAGDHAAAARHLATASRLRPGDAGAAARAERALDMALLASLRTTVRPLVALALLVLLGTLARTWRRRRHARVRRAWVASLRPRLRVSVDGRRVPRGEPARLPPYALSLVLDLFLDGSPGPPARGAEGPSARTPRPGPTLGIVLSHATTGRSLRLTPRRDVRDDAVRIRLRDETLSRVTTCPGTWRLQARLDGRLVADAPLCVASPRRSAEPVGRARRKPVR